MLRNLRRLSRVIHLRATRWGVLALLSLIVTIALHELPATAQGRAITQATITEILQGNQVYIQNRLARARDLARLGEQVRTRQARVSLRFNTGAIGRLGTNALLTVGRQCFQLQRGQILVNGAANGCTRNSITGVRGTTYLLEVDTRQQERVTVLEGQVSITRRVGGNRPPGSRPVASPVLLAAGQRVTISDRGVVGQVQSLTRSEFDQVLRSAVFQGFREPLPGINALRESYQRLYPGTVFPLDDDHDDDDDDQNSWDSTMRLSRFASQGRSA